jgi:hypothetical protein
MAGCGSATRSGDRRHALLDQGDASFALLDCVSDDGQAVIDVRGKDGPGSQVTLNVADLEQRHKLTEPDQLYRARASSSGIRACRRSSAKVCRIGRPSARPAPGDEIVAVDDTPIRSFNEIGGLRECASAQTMTLTVTPDGTSCSSA